MAVKSVTLAPYELCKSVTFASDDDRERFIASNKDYAGRLFVLGETKAAAAEKKADEAEKARKEKSEENLKKTNEAAKKNLEHIGQPKAEIEVKEG